MNTVLIVSKNGEVSTCEVIDWLDHFGVNFFRINNGGINKIPASIELENGIKLIAFERDNKELNLEDIDTVWFRKTISPQAPNTQLIENKEIAKLIETHTMNELEAYNFSFYHLFDKKSLNHPDRKEINKPLQLDIAQKIGFNIPASLLTSDKTKLVNFKNKYPELIVKAIFRSRGFLIDKVFHAGFTAVLTDEFIQQLPQTFFPVLVQENIEKAYEIRTFYLDGTCHSMAIFSQMDKQTQIDFRQYNHQKPNRTVPFVLPQSITKKIIAFMDKIKLNSGSLDFIRSKDGKFYFLEVNPNGQFGMVSKPCNYFLEKKIATWLKN
ncbi:MAG: grasp-with-spasm system ATP-grasp peptide maturase [Chitinophagales bacterium]